MLQDPYLDDGDSLGLARATVIALAIMTGAVLVVAAALYAAWSLA